MKKFLFALLCLLVLLLMLPAAFAQDETYGSFLSPQSQKEYNAGDRITLSYRPNKFFSEKVVESKAGSRRTVSVETNIINVALYQCSTGEKITDWDIPYTKTDFNNGTVLEKTFTLSEPGEYYFNADHFAAYVDPFYQTEEREWFGNAVTGFFIVPSVKLNKTKATLYQRKDTNNRDTLQLKLTVTPSDATNQTVTWKSSKPTVAKVDENGLVTAIKKGTAVITATVKDGSKTRTKTCTITVKKNDKSVTRITAKPKKLTLKKGQKATVVLTFKPTGVYNNKVKWTTSNKKIATIRNGVITAKKKGKCTITATATDKSKKKVTIKITVR